MQNELPIPDQDIEAIIDRQPLIVTPTTLLPEVIALMSQGRSSYSHTPISSVESGLTHRIKPSSSVLVMCGTNILGIITERDIVRLAAEEISLSGLRAEEVMTVEVITLPLSALRNVFGPLFLFRRYQIRHLPIIGDRGELIGVVSADSIRELVRPIDLLKLKRVSEVMTTPVVMSPLTASVSDVARLMALHRVSCVVITQERELLDGEMSAFPVGIITERDIVQFQALQINIAQMDVDRVMSSPLFLLQASDSLWTAYQEMQNRHVRRLVVTWNWGKCFGIITQTNLLRSLDPKEMYDVEKTVKETVEYTKREKIQQIFKQRISEQDQLGQMLEDMSLFLENFLKDNDRLSDLQKLYVESALGNIEYMQHLVCSLKQRTEDLNNIAVQGDGDSLLGGGVEVGVGKLPVFEPHTKIIN